MYDCWYLVRTSCKSKLYILCMFTYETKNNYRYIIRSILYKTNIKKVYLLNMYGSCIYKCNHMEQKFIIFIF